MSRKGRNPEGERLIEPSIIVEWLCCQAAVFEGIQLNTHNHELKESITGNDHGISLCCIFSSAFASDGSFIPGRIRHPFRCAGMRLG